MGTGVLVLVGDEVCVGVGVYVEVAVGVKVAVGVGVRVGVRVGVSVGRGWKGVGVSDPGNMLMTAACAAGLVERVQSCLTENPRESSR